ncbi:hypothetical protein [Streptomyces cyaneofuscatus]|uniref:hypothetical protein n=1 Tax=Streptomyces cyaneofuscatus TaxID=66883 RepID=UPI0037D43B5E
MWSSSVNPKSMRSLLSSWGLRPQTPAPQSPEGLGFPARPAFEDRGPGRSPESSPSGD